jgi:hypothetical protein
VNPYLLLINFPLALHQLEVEGGIAHEEEEEVEEEQLSIPTSVVSEAATTNTSTKQNLPYSSTQMSELPSPG